MLLQHSTVFRMHLDALQPTTGQSPLQKLRESYDILEIELERDAYGYRFVDTTTAYGADNSECR